MVRRGRYKLEHDGRQTNYTMLIDSHQVLWESPSKVLLQQQKHGKPTKVISKKTTPNKPLQQPVLTDTLVPGDGSFLCNFCDKEFSHVAALAALDHWIGSHSNQDVYTNTAIGTNVRIQEMFRLVGRCGYLACGKYVAVSGANPLHLKNIFRMHYKNEHGDVVKFFDKSVGGACNVHDKNKKSVPQIFTDINKKAS